MFFMAKQTRIFAPFNDNYPDEYWYQNILGRIIKPITAKWSNLNWFWFSLYDGGLNIQNNEDCDVSRILGSYLNNEKRTRSIRFRYSIEDVSVNEFEADLQSAILTNHCFISDFRNWNMINDVGSEIHLGGQRTPERKIHRSDVLARLYHQMSLLTLDALEETSPSNNFVFEKIQVADSKFQDSPFASPHHIFCNMTKVPLITNLGVEIELNNKIKVTSETGWGMSNWVRADIIQGKPIKIDNFTILF